MCSAPGDANGAVEGKKSGFLLRLSFAVERSMARFFTNLGEKVGRRPLLTVFLCLVVVLIGASGISVLVNEARGDKLWLPSDTRSQDELVVYESYFPKEGRTNLVITTPAEGASDADALSKENLVKAMAFYNVVNDISVTYEGETYVLDDLCVTSFEHDSTPCKIESVLEKWGYDADILAADNAVLETINNGSTVAELDNYLGGLTLSDDGSSALSAEAISITLFIKNTDRVVDGAYTDPIPEAWEEKFIDIGQECVSGLQCFVEAERSFSDEFGSAITNDISLILGSYIIIIIYTAINLSGKPFLKSRVLLSIGAVLVVGFSIIVSIGVASYMGFFYTPLHTILPFILLGLGVDDSFVICNAFGNADPSLDLPKRMGVALGSAGVSITVTSLTDFVAFVISASTRLPALSSFCVYSAFGILAVYIFQATLFSAFVVLDAKRQANRRVDCCPCFHVRGGRRDEEKEGEGGGEVKGTERGRLARFIGDVYAPLLKIKAVKAMVIVAFAALLVMGAYGASKLEVADTERSFIPDGSYLLDTTDAIDKYFNERGMRVEIVTLPFDYFQEQEAVGSIAERLSGLSTSPPYIQEPETSGTFFSWYDDLVDWAEADGTATLTTTSQGLTVFADETEFYTSLSTFLDSDDGDGARYNVSVVRAGVSTIEATSISSEFIGSITLKARKQVDAMDGIREIVDSWEIDAFPWTYEFLQFETLKIIYRELVQGLGLCMVAVFFVTLILLAHPTTAVLVSLCVMLTLVEVTGVMYFWNLNIDTVAVINLVLAVGLSVDYSAHVGHSFIIMTGTKDERMVKALADIGVAVVHGGVSTFLAVVLLSLSSSFVFRVMFKQFFATVVLGLGHGLIFLPVVLSLIGPSSQGDVPKPKSSALVSG